MKEITDRLKLKEFLDEKNWFEQGGKTVETAATKANGNIATVTYFLGDTPIAQQIADKDSGTVRFFIDAA